jgi:hypothetical protein
MERKGDKMNRQAKDELEFIRQQNGGFLRPSDVVDFARDKQTVIHRYFEWDDSEAAEKYRLAQAQSLIRVAVIVSEETSEKVRAFVSLSDDRKTGKGYRSIIEVMADKDLSERLLEDAKQELISFTRKYNSIKRLSAIEPVFSSIESLIASSDVRAIA